MFNAKKIENDKGVIGVWIGPEGGWSVDEIKKAREASFVLTNLGKFALRAETAAVIGSYLALNINSKGCKNFSELIP